MTSRQYKWALLVLAVSGLAGGTLGSWLLPGRAAFVEEEALQVVTARKFRLVDEAGKTRATLGLTEDGQPGLGLWDETENEKPRAALYLSDEGQPGLVLLDEAGKTRAVMHLAEDGQPFLGLWDETENEKPRAGLGLTQDGWSFLGLSDKAGRTRAVLALREDGHASLRIADAEGNNRAVVGCTATVNKHTGAEINYPESTVTLYKANGDVIWQAP